MAARNSAGWWKSIIGEADPGDIGRYGGRYYIPFGAWTDGFSNGDYKWRGKVAGRKVTRGKSHPVNSYAYDIASQDELLLGLPYASAGIPTVLSRSYSCPA